jgi:hypothetical protein
MIPEQLNRRVADELEIRNIIARIGMATDAGHSEEYAAQFSEDAHIEMRMPPGKPSAVPPTKGRAAILAASKKRRDDGNTGPASHRAHGIQTSLITVMGDTAKAKTYVVVYANINSAPVAASLLTYNDEYVRTPEGWKLAVRFIDPS